MRTEYQGSQAPRFRFSESSASLFDMPSGVAGLHERMSEVLKAKGWSQRRWAREAGITQTHTRLIIERSKADPENPSVEVWIIARLADAAGVSLDWLVSGRGTMRGSPQVEPDPQYPSRAAVVAACHALGLPESAVSRIQGITGLAVDPGEEFWLAQAFAARAGVAGLLPAKPAHLKPQDPGTNRPKRRTKK